MRNHKGKREEKIVKEQFFLEDIEEEQRAEFKDRLYPTQEKKIAIFLKALGHNIRGFQEKSFDATQGYKKRIVIFFFEIEKTVARAKVLDLYNNSNVSCHNVNAKLLLEAEQDISAMISNFLGG